MCVLQKLLKQRGHLRRKVKQLTAYVRSVTAPESEVGPMECAAEEVFALRLARQHNPELIKWIPRPITYPENVRIFNIDLSKGNVTNL